MTIQTNAIVNPRSPAPSVWTSLPYAQFKRDPHFYVKYDGLYALATVAVIGAIFATGYHAPVQAFEWWVPLLLVPATYVVIMAHVFIHNASHGNFPKALNRIVGEICGVIVLTKFTSWEIVHRRHHRHPDDAEHDPHPAERSYWPYAWHTLVRVEQQLQNEYYDCHGDTPASRRYERIRSVWSFATSITALLAWFLLLGPVLFFVVFVPASVLAGLFVIHFNWSGHNAHTETGAIEPVNIDSGWFWLGNRLFFGIYFHANHHRVARVFNPMYAPLPRAERASVQQSVQDEAQQNLGVEELA